MSEINLQQLEELKRTLEILQNGWAHEVERKYEIILEQRSEHIFYIVKENIKYYKNLINTVEQQIQQIQQMENTR
ncbi:putative ORFan [Cotonvirus japonicus]|uniref:ORFan n=1 Tax=Cotonvirus japonicus TaxID=2811091 RepID=A0ABM7NRK5_9VIRU|nr:putative ORFan [Cotonvirus japonicus]BCS82795.1 putative ORFan [Cotonvirus japonicus]